MPHPTFAPPEGSRSILPAEALQRAKIISTLRTFYDRWGYARIEPSVLEYYDPQHPRAEQSFKLSDRDSGVLALRSDFTPAVAKLVQGHYPQANAPMRFQYHGKVWQAINPEVARTREISQIGLELVGVSSARADAELIHLARESVRLVGLTPRVEVGNPGFVRALFDLAQLPETLRDEAASAIDRKDYSSLNALIKPLELSKELCDALLSVADLYGDVSVLKRARTLAPWPETARELDRLEAILTEFEDDSELLLDLGMARRRKYYTSMTFRAYTFDFGQPLLGGGRYDGALLPYAAGFTLGIERLLSALPPAPLAPVPLVLSLHDGRAKSLREAGFSVERSLYADVDEARAYAKARGVSYLLTEKTLEALNTAAPQQNALQEILEAVS